MSDDSLAFGAISPCLSDSLGHPDVRKNSSGGRIDVSNRFLLPLEELRRSETLHSICSDKSSAKIVYHSVFSDALVIPFSLALGCFLSQESFDPSPAGRPPL